MNLMAAKLLSLSSGTLNTGNSSLLDFSLFAPELLLSVLLSCIFLLMHSRCLSKFLSFSTETEWLCSPFTLFLYILLFSMSFLLPVPSRSLHYVSHIHVIQLITDTTSIWSEEDLKNVDSSLQSSSGALFHIEYC